MKIIKDFCSAAVVLIIAVITVPFIAKAQSVHNEQYIALQNWQVPTFKITFGAPTTLASNYTFLLPKDPPTSLNQTLIVDSIGSGNVYGLGWQTTTASVTSVGLAMPSIFTVTNSPVITTGTLTAALNTQAANLVFAGPSSGAAAVPTFRTLSPADIPTLPYVSSVGLALPTNEFTVSGSPVTSSGTLTGSWKPQAANLFFGGPASGASTTPTFRAITPSDIPALPYVSSVGLAMPSIFSVSGSPVTTTGTLTAALANEAANLVFAGPATGAATTPTFRALVPSDIPSMPGSYILNGTSLQSSANFNISGSGTFGTNATINGLLQLKGSTSGMTSFQAAATGPTITYTLPSSGPAAGQVLSSNATGVLSWITGSGTVSSVGLAMPSIFTVTNSPVTTTGTLTAALNTQAANLVFAGPSSGAAAVPTFRALTPSDVPTLPYVSSVGLALPTNEFTVTGSPVTSSGTLTGSWKPQTQNLFFAGPSSGAAATPSFRAIQSIDIPVLPYVSSVGLAMPSIFTVSGSPVTTSGTLTAALASEGANLVFAGPATGAATTPTFRALVPADIPSMPGTYILNSTSLQSSSNFHISDNGEIEKQLQLKGTSTGMTTFQAGAQGTNNINYTLPTAQGTSGTVLTNNGSGVLSWVDQSSTVGAIKFAIKSSDESISNSSTLQNDDDLSFTIGANETWELIAQLDTYTTAEDGDAPNIKVAVTIPSGTLHVFATGNGGTDIYGNWLTTSGTANVNTFEVTDEDEFGPVVMQGMIVGGSTGGTVHIQWAPSSSSSNAITVRKNSYLKATRAN